MQFSLTNLFFPYRSLRGESGNLVTREEWKDLQSYPLTMDSRSLAQEGCHSLDLLLAAHSYAGSALLRRMVFRYKYAKVRALAEPLGRLLLPATRLLPRQSDIVICPVPLHWTRRYWRGFNQAELLADIVAREREWPVQQLLFRRKITKQQARLEGKQLRRQSVGDAFDVLLEGKELPKSVLLIDDVATSCSTLNSCARVLKEAGVQWVSGLVIARG